MNKNLLRLTTFASVLFFFCAPQQHFSPETGQGRDKAYTIPAVPDSILVSLRKFQNSRSSALQGWLPDGSGIIIRTRFDDTEQLHLVAGPGAARHQITFRAQGVVAGMPAPKAGSGKVYFIEDTGGNELFQLYSQDLATNNVTLLSDGASRNGLPKWANRGDRFVFSSTRRNGRDFDIYISEIATPSEAKLLYSSGGLWSAIDWSPDDSRILLSHYVSRTASFLYVLDLSTGALTAVFEPGDTLSQEVGVFDKSGQGVYFTSDKESDIRSLRHRDLRTGAETILTSDIQLDVAGVVISPDRETLVFNVMEHGFKTLYFIDTPTFVRRRITTLPTGVIEEMQFDPEGLRLALTIHRPDRPGDVYVLNIDNSNIDRWTSGELGEIDSSVLVTPEVFYYPTFDSVGAAPRQIPCFYFRPYLSASPFGVLILIHGGPESQYWPKFSPEVQYYVSELNLAVLAPNVRGSAGYGKEYLSLDDGMRREDAVKDIGALIAWIKDQPELDNSRIAVMGGSYGGYMVLASMIHFGEDIRAGVNIFGISNFLTFLDNTAPYRRDLRRVEYGDERDPDMRAFLQRISPLSNASRIRSPLLVIQGVNDPRVPVGESLQIAGEVKRNGGEVWLHLIENEGHGFRRKSNRDLQEAIKCMFLQRFLK